MKKVKITYRGWPGHLCVGWSCVFHLNTLLECEKTKIVVSTVGMYMPNSSVSSKIETIGLDRYYETMAFRASKHANGFIDADVGRQLSFPGKWGCSDPRDEAKANNMHLRVVDYFKKVLAAGKLPKQKS